MGIYRHSQIQKYKQACSSHRDIESHRREHKKKITVGGHLLKNNNN